MIIHQRSIPLTCLTASIAKPIKYDKEHDLIGCKKSRCLSPDLRRIFGHGGRGHLLYGRTCNPGQRRSQAQISSMKPLLRHGQLTAQQNIKGRMPCIYFGLNLFCSQVAMRPPCVAIIERAKCNEKKCVRLIPRNKRIIELHRIWRRKREFILKCTILSSCFDNEHFFLLVNSSRWIFGG